MKALTIDAPWAWLIVNGHKAVENRTWRTNYRGQLAIHAGRSSRSDELAAKVCVDLDVELPDDWTLYRGCVLGTVEVVDVVAIQTLTPHPFHTGPHCWLFEQPFALERGIIARGQQNLWNWSESF